MNRKYLNVVMVALLLGSSTNIYAKKNHHSNEPQQGDNSVYFAPTQNPDIPNSINFAGQKISLDRMDMYERFDRELTSLAFGHSNTLLTIKRANKLFPIIVPILKANGIPEDFAYLAAIESYLNLRAYSGAKAAGIWQILATTGKEYGLEVSAEVDERFDPEKSTYAAVKYLKKAYQKYGDWPTVAASYNGGMGRISSELSKQMGETSFDLYLTEETSRYVFRIMAMKMIMENPRTYGFLLSKEQLYQPVKFTKEVVSGDVSSWCEWAKQRGISYQELRELNPWIRTNSLTNKTNKKYEVKIPLKNELYRSKRDFKSYNPKWIGE